MAPTICSGKKRESRRLINSSIRRNGQGSHQLNQTLSNIVNYVAKGSSNARVSTSLRIKSQSQLDKSIANNTVGDSLKHRQKQFSFLSDNAVTSSTHSDTENSFDLRLANAASTNNSTPTYSDNTNSTSLSSPSSSSLLSSSTQATTSQNERTSSSYTSPNEEKRFHRYSFINTDSSDNDEMNLFKANRGDENATILKAKPNEIHSSNMKNHYNCNYFDSDEDEEQEEFNSHDLSDVSDNGMNTDEDDSMTSLDTEKSAKLKKSNHPLLRDKLLTKQQQIDEVSGNQTDDNRKSLSSLRSTDGLLSIAIKTIKLIKRNKLLQQRLTQLQMETSEFIQSVLSNPENRHFRENMKQCKRQEVDNV